MRTRKFKKHVLLAVTSVKQHIDTNPCHVLSNSYLASSTGISRNVLQTAFKDQYGTDIGEYKLKVRMLEAKHLLRWGWSIKQISIELHYASSSAFSKAFRNYFNVRPSEWINKREVHTVNKHVENPGKS
jgi:AraC-like DNA-binding protein